jgi:hypothetical protein
VGVLGGIMSGQHKNFIPVLLRKIAIAVILLTPLVYIPVSADNPVYSHAVYLPILHVNQLTGGYDVVFVSRQIPDDGSIYWDGAKGMAGVGPYSRFQVAAPGQLMVRQTDGQLKVLVDGENPHAESLNLIDVNAPDVSYDGSRIVFAGLPAGNYDHAPAKNPGAWRIYTINADGTDLTQITFSDQSLDLAGNGLPASLAPYDDTDPVWLPDGRIAFSSTRWPSVAQYSGVRTTNLYVVNADGSNLHRITAERNGADRPMVDPVTGKIVYARWWRNHRFPTNDMSTVMHPSDGYIQHNGLTLSRSNHVGGPDAMWRNTWHAAEINPDGTGLAQWGGTHHALDSNHMYGGAFRSDGQLVANYFPMTNMSEASGFGGLRLYQRGPGYYQPILGITGLTGNLVSPNSFGIFTGAYATEPYVLPNNRLLFSWSADYYQDYGLYSAEPDGSNRVVIYDRPDTAELRVKAIRSRPLPPVISDTVTTTASLLPPPANGSYDQDGTFVFDALNIYANGPVDSAIESAPAVGSAATIRFFLDHQRSSSGSFPNQDWPILLGELPVAPDGSITEPDAPANVPLFEQLRGSDNTVPPLSIGGAHVAGMNFGPPGTVARCVGCHAGHTMIPVPTSAEEAKWSNLAPGAAVTVSSSRDTKYDRGVIDRKVMTGEIYRYWNSSPGEPADGQWVQLTFPVPVTVRTVRLYNPRFGDSANSSLQIHQATVKLFSDTSATTQIAAQTISQDIEVTGTDIQFSDIQARVVRIEIDDISGTFYGIALASLAEVEVIARGEASP